MRTLILSCNTGEGHNSCAKAIKEVFVNNGEECDMADALSFVSKSLSKMVAGCHVGMYRYLPGLFRFGYQYSQKHPAMLEAGSGIYWILTLGSKKLHRYIVENGYDTVICTHVFSGLIMTQVLKDHALKTATYFVATDYVCNPGTKGSVLDTYFIPDRMFDTEYKCRNIPDEKLVVTGIPVRQSFYRTMEKDVAKRRFQIGADKKHLLMMCGSMGCGPMIRLSRRLREILHDDMVLTIVCGTNKWLKRKLEYEHKGRENIRILGYVTEMSELMDSADLYLTKPGGISVSEAAVKRLPMVFVNAVAGCEEYNRIFFIKSGCADTASSVESLAGLCVSLLENEERREHMRENFNKLETSNAAGRIFTYIKEKCGNENRETSC